MQIRPQSISPQRLAATLLGLAAVALTPCSMAADNATATATALVLQPIAVTKSADLVFGNLLADNGTVTIATSGARTKAGGTIALPAVGATPLSAARFDVTGTGNNTFAIDYTGSTAVLTSGSDTMAMTLISEALSGASPTATGLTTPGTAATGTLGTGAASIFVGATLVVGATQPAGTYTGSVKVTVAYN